MVVVHWVWHFMLWGAGYQVCSGPIIVGGLYQHFNCEEPGCWRLGHRHPGHGRPVCLKHYDSDKAAP